MARASPEPRHVVARCGAQCGHRGGTFWGTVLERTHQRTCVHSEQWENSEMGKIENLKPWQSGQSGNPGGRPKKKPITELYEQLLNDGATVRAIRAAIL